MNSTSTVYVISLGILLHISLFYLFSPACKGSWGWTKRALSEGKQTKFYIFSVQAVKKNIPILIDAERPREGLDDLLKLADYVVCSAKFPKASVFFSLELVTNVLYQIFSHQHCFHFINVKMILTVHFAVPSQSINVLFTL